MELNEKQFGFMLKKGKVNTLLIVRKPQEYLQKDRKLYLHFVHLENGDRECNNLSYIKYCMQMTWYW